ncbi:hypothetical protein ACFPTR_05450 [Aliibacillus thermotolerans]|uniref:Uncharacterized protein n=1 Tax=Aliibacillus thermotolerans TaxID=1834418 RepID=A0ABW0U4D1_9BACI|nr:hypothetical protein [Aliibacillus thermotolerans]MDA3129876.1 hypothetical protein [Aliibacillus thermotolerans]
MGYILIDDHQIPAEKFASEMEAKKNTNEKELVVKDDDGDFWVIYKEDYEKVEPFGYSIIK